MIEAYEYSDYNQAMQKMKELEKKNKKYKILIYTIDYDQNEESKKITTPAEGCKLIRKAKTIFLNRDEIIEHMQLYSTIQDIEHINREGIMHDIILPHLKE